MYGLRDNPFVSSPIIRIDSTDKRLNGRLYCKELAVPQLKKFNRLASFEKPAMYVNSEREVLGTGKSAFMASAYWDMVDSKSDYNAVWVEATGNTTINSILGKVVDTLVVRKYISHIKESIDVSSSAELRKVLSQSTSSPSGAVIDALRKILELPDEQIAWKYSNIRRSIPMYSLTEIFGAILKLLFAIETKKHFFFFVDQFEEYVMKQ